MRMLLSLNAFCSACVKPLDRFCLIPGSRRFRRIWMDKTVFTHNLSVTLQTRELSVGEVLSSVMVLPEVETVVV